MEQEFIKVNQIIEKNEEEKDRELLLSIITTREKLEQAHKNFEFAEEELIDYYTYNIKANQAKLDYLIKLAKEKGLVMNSSTQLKLSDRQEVG